LCAYHCQAIPGLGWPERIPAGRKRMNGLNISEDTSRFEVAAVLDASGKLTAGCAREAVEKIDTYGFVIVTDLLSHDEADAALEMVRQTADDPDRKLCTFASETDNRYKRRDFCSLPPTPFLKSFAGTLCQRLEGVISEYCRPSHRLLEAITLISYQGSSHQYFHRDPPNVLSFFAAFQDVSQDQGGTVFVPGTHKYPGVEKRHGGLGLELMNLLMIRANMRLFVHNFRKLWNMRKGIGGALAPGEFRDRVFSTRWDEYQPNILRFLTNRNTHLSLRTFRPGTLRALWRNRQAIRDQFQFVRTTPRKGTVIVFRSDTIHAGPDNCSPVPRQLYGMSISRDIIDPVHMYDGYSPHPELIAEPLTYGDLLAMPPLGVHLSAPIQCEAVAAE
jgi:ectoine hydroxylase-related dioxygenase (phytanoyl-CoA dioxygenase family)